MEAYDVYLGLVGYEKPGRILCVSGAAARESFYRYEDDEQCRQREGVSSCWVTKASSSEPPILGTAPENWSSDSPVYENNTVHGRLK